MAKRGPKPKFDNLSTANFQIALTPEVLETLVFRAKEAGYDYRGGTVDYAREILIKAIENNPQEGKGAAIIGGQEKAQ